MNFRYFFAIIFIFILKYSVFYTTFFLHNFHFFRKFVAKFSHSLFCENFGFFRKTDWREISHFLQANEMRKWSEMVRKIFFSQNDLFLLLETLIRSWFCNVFFGVGRKKMWRAFPPSEDNNLALCIYALIHNFWWFLKSFYLSFFFHWIFNHQATNCHFEKKNVF